MAYPKALLSDGEEVVLDLHRHWRALVVPIALVPLLVGIGSYLAAVAPSGRFHHPFQIGVLVLTVVALLWLSLLPYLRWVTRHYVVTNRRVVLREGIVARKGRDIPLNRVNDVTFSHTVLERLIGAGTLTIESAGERGQVTLADVPKVEKVQRTVYDLVQAEEERMRLGQPSGEDLSAPEPGA